MMDWKSKRDVDDDATRLYDTGHASGFLHCAGVAPWVGVGSKFVSATEMQ
jgi:hypothetical protein